jgi:hypothetical protein
MTILMSKYSWSNVLATVAINDNDINYILQIGYVQPHSDILYIRLFDINEQLVRGMEVRHLESEIKENEYNGIFARGDTHAIYSKLAKKCVAQARRIEKLKAFI